MECADTQRRFKEELIDTYQIPGNECSCRIHDAMGIFVGHLASEKTNNK
jgi:hypothetical protein